MGQQQLLLVILVTIIVGIATVVAINVFTTGAKSANEDAVRQDVLVIASAAQGWYLKPKMMDGGNNSFDGLTFKDVNFAADTIRQNDFLAASNMNGTYVITPSGQTFTVDAYPASDEGYDHSQAFSTSGKKMTATVSKGNISW